jgi:hypothetical protein
MNADFRNTNDEPVACCCKCCQYRQYIKGEYKGEYKGEEQVISHPLPGGKNLQKDSFLEDGLPKANPKIFPGYKADQPIYFGHRGDPGFAFKDGPPNDVYRNPNRADGCGYRGDDKPAMDLRHGYPGFTMKVDLVFKGIIIDVCQQGIEVESKTWTVKLEHKTTK